MNFFNSFSKFRDGLKKAMSSKPVYYEKKMTPAERKRSVGTSTAKYNFSKEPSNGKGVGY
jgi:hypothetical protein